MIRPKQMSNCHKNELSQFKNVNIYMRDRYLRQASVSKNDHLRVTLYLNIVLKMLRG